MNIRLSGCTSYFITASRDKLKPNFAIEANEIQTALGLVAADIGVTLVPQSVSRLRLGDVVFLSLADSEILSPVIIGFRRDNQTDLLAAIISYAQTELRQATEEQPREKKISTTRSKK